jgi:hypothetical protein
MPIQTPSPLQPLSELVRQRDRSLRNRVVGRLGSEAAARRLAGALERRSDGVAELTVARMALRTEVRATSLSDREEEARRMLGEDFADDQEMITLFSRRLLDAENRTRSCIIQALNLIEGPELEIDNDPYTFMQRVAAALPTVLDGMTVAA